MHWPTWLTWANAWPVLSGIPGWIALWLALRKHSREKTILEFTVRATHVEANEDEPTNMSMDGTPMVRALWVTITNTGQKPITIFEVFCKWSGVNRDGKEYERDSRDWVNKKLGEGDHCFSSPHIYTKPKAILAAWAVDSTGKQWNVPDEVIIASGPLTATRQNMRANSGHGHPDSRPATSVNARFPQTRHDFGYRRGRGFGPTRNHSLEGNVSSRLGSQTAWVIFGKQPWVNPASAEVCGYAEGHFGTVPGAFRQKLRVSKASHFTKPTLLITPSDPYAQAIRRGCSSCS